ncbi:MAG: phnA protein [Neptuniibacter sp.]
MSKGHERHIERHHGLSLFGKDLVRRSSSHCELCDAQGVRLSIYEVPPVSSDPEFEHCIMLCGTCLEQVERPKLRDSNHWRCLNHSVWSNVPAVKVLAVAMLRELSNQESWAIELYEQLYLEPEESDWISAIDLS